jgi:hypothetical protein
MHRGSSGSLGAQDSFTFHLNVLRIRGLVLETGQDAGTGTNMS